MKEGENPGLIMSLWGGQVTLCVGVFVDDTGVELSPIINVGPEILQEGMHLWIYTAMTIFFLWDHVFMVAPRDAVGSVNRTAYPLAVLS